MAGAALSKRTVSCSRELEMTVETKLTIGSSFRNHDARKRQVRGWSVWQAAIAVVLLLLTGPQPAAATPHPDSTLYDAIQRLKTLGIMPLWAGVARPTSLSDFRAAVAEATRRSQGTPLSAADLTLLAQLRREVGLDSIASPSARLDAGPGAVQFGLSRPYATFFHLSGTTEWALGWANATPFNVGAVTFPAGPVTLAVGRAPLGWGPAGPGGLLFSETAGGFDRIQASGTVSSARFTRAVGWLDGNRSVVATRLDLAPRSNFRIGIGESILMQGAPYLVYAIAPVPLLLNYYLLLRSRVPSGFDDNYLFTLDAEWVLRPGLRVFGELLIDDITFTSNLPSRWGLTLGFLRVVESGGDLTVLYTRVPNWTYSATPSSPQYLLRGLPLGHPLGADFDLLFARWTAGAQQPAYWGTLIRKGEGVVGRLWTSEAEARQFVFLRGVVEYALVLGFEAPFHVSGWTGTVGPWVAYRLNAGHLPGLTRIDGGFGLWVTRSF